MLVTPFLRPSCRTPRRLTSVPSYACLRRYFSAENDVPHRPAIVEIANATVFPFGVPTDDASKASMRGLSLTIADSDCWAVLSASTAAHKATLISTIRGYNRVEPRGARRYPILASLPLRPRPPGQGPPREAEIDDVIQYVHFRTRLAQTGSGFQDYTARYYAIRDEDKVTLRESLRASLPYFEGSTESDDEFIERLATTLRVESLLDHPLVTLSNGQNRRASILRGLLHRPELIILEEPFSALSLCRRSAEKKLTANDGSWPRCGLSPNAY